MESPAAQTLIQPIPLTHIVPSPYQARKTFDPAGLQELADSMKQHGLLQPILVRTLGESQFELIAGERRWRAAKLLGWETLLAQIETLTDEEAAEQGLVENLQRVDLNPIEAALGYRRLTEPPYNKSHEEIAQAVGKTKSVITRLLALLNFPQEIQDLVARATVSVRHTRILAQIPDLKAQIALAEQVDREGWSVRELEEQVKRERGNPGIGALDRASRSPSPRFPQDPLADLWPQLLQNPDLKTRSRLTYKPGGTWSFAIPGLQGLDLDQPPATLQGQIREQIAEVLGLWANALKGESAPQPAPIAVSRPLVVKVHPGLETPQIAQPGLVNGRVMLAWTEVPNAISYQIYIAYAADQPLTPAPKFQLFQKGEASFGTTGSPHHEAWLAVKALGDGKESAVSEPVHVKWG